MTARTLDRRQLLLAGAATVLLARHATARTAEPPAPPAIPVHRAWDEALRVELWPGQPPGASRFDPGSIPPDWPASYRRAVAMPDLRVFTPRQSNGRALLVMPG